MSGPYRSPPAPRTRRTAQSCPSCGLTCPGAALRCDCGFDFGSGVRLPSRQRRHREFDLRQQVGVAMIGLVVGGIIGPLLLVLDSERPWRGLFFIVISPILIIMGVRAWFLLPKDQRNWKALRAPRNAGEAHVAAPPPRTDPHA